MNDHKKLPTSSLTMIEKIQHPESAKNLEIDSPAFEILTDFKLARPLMIEQGTSVASAKEMMSRERVRLKLVIDREDRFKGVISLADLLSVKVMQARAKTGLSLDELSIKDVMIHRDALHAIEIREFNHATIGDVLVTMEAAGDQHVLVYDAEDNSLRGIISSSDIARALHKSVYISDRAHSFSDFYQAVRG